MMYGELATGYGEIIVRVILPYNGIDIRHNVYIVSHLGGGGKSPLFRLWKEL